MHPQPTPDPAAELRLSHQPRLLHAGREWMLQPRDALLAAWLALRGPTPRGRAVSLLWPEGEAESGRGALRQRLYKLRQTVGFELFVGQQTLALSDGVVHDLTPLSPLLEGVEDIAVGDELAAWLSLERGRRRSATRQHRLAAIAAAEAAADWPAALREALDWLQAEPDLEEAHRRVMRLHYVAGDRSAALDAYRRCERMLERTLGARPSAQTLELLRLLHDEARPEALGGSGPVAPPLPAAASPARRAAAGSGYPTALLRPPRLVGRDAEVAAANGAWEQGKVVALVAEAGMGKTRLLQQLARAGRSVMVAARPGDASVPLSTLARLLRAWAPDLAPLPEAPRHAVGRLLPGVAADAPPPAAASPGSPQPLQQALGLLLATPQAPHQLLIDDLHFADSASLALLLAAIDQSPRSLAWALGYRPAEADAAALRSLHDTLLDDARLLALGLGPLAEPALADLVDSLALPGFDGATLAPMLRRRTGGNPLFVLETLKQMWSDGTPPALAESTADAAAHGRSPPSVIQLIARRMARLSPQALALARCAAVAGSDFSTELAVEVLRTPAIALADGWAELEAAGVLRDQAFAHDLVYECTLAGVPAAIARHLHGEVAAFLAARGGAAPAALARHWLAAGRVEPALPALRAAAESAAQAYDLAESGRLWGELAELQHARGEREAAFASAEAAADVLRTQTTGPALEAALQRLESLADTPEQRASVCRHRAEQALDRGDHAAASAIIEQGLLRLGQTAAPGPRVALLVALGVAERRLTRLDDSRRTQEQALALIRASSDPLLQRELPAVLNSLGLVLQEQDQHLAAVAQFQEAAERQSDPTLRARVLNNAAFSLEEQGQLGLAYEQRLAAARLVAGSGSLVEAMLGVTLASTSRSLGRLRESAAHLERARTLMQGRGFHAEGDLCRNEAALWMLVGRFNLAREALQAASRVAPESGEQREILQMSQARLALALGDRDQARALLEPVARRWQGAGFRRGLRRVWVLLAATLPPDESLALVDGELASALPGASVQLRARQAQALLSLGEADAAWQAAERAIDRMELAHPVDLTPAELWLTLARAAQAAGAAPRAADAAQRGVAWVDWVARDHLDPIYRDSWRAANRVNAELLALAPTLRDRH